MAAHRVAAIDIGTVTTRLLIAEVTPDRVTELVRCTDITHLGEGLAVAGRLSDRAMRRVDDIIGGYAATLSTHKVEAVRAIATSASRDASNAAEFMALLAPHGIVFEVITGDAEARLAFAGATWAHTCAGVLVNDIGGGSTEIILGSVVDAAAAARCRVDYARSVDVGARRVTEMFLHTDPPSASEMSAAREWIRLQFTEVAAELPASPKLSLALAGTATTLAAIALRLTVYDSERVHGSTLTLNRIDELTGMLAILPLHRRQSDVAGLDPARAPVIVAGGLILGELLRAVGLDSTVVSEHDILYGIVLELAEGLSDSGETML